MPARAERLPGRKLGKLARGFSASLAALLLAAAAAELLVRGCTPSPEILHPYRVRVEYQGRWQELPASSQGILLAKSTDPALAGLRGEFRPNTRFQLCYDARGNWRRPYFDENGCVTFTINADGYRGPLRPKERQQGIYRIALVGDSFTFGHGVPFDATWGAVLERTLNAHLAESKSDSKVEVLNFGVSGYDVLDDALVLRHKALRWQNDRVLYGFFLNDLFVAQKTTAPEDDLWRNIDERALGESLFGAPRGLAAYSRLLFLAERSLAARRIDRLTRAVYARAGLPGTAHFEAWRAGLADMADAARAAGVPLDVVIFPELVSLRGAHPFVAVYAAVAAAARDLGLGVVQVFDAFKGRRASDLWVHPTDHHPNEIADGEAGRLVAGYLQSVEPRLR